MRDCHRRQVFRRKLRWYTVFLDSRRQICASKIPMAFFCSFLRCANKVSRVYGCQSCEGLFQLLVIRCWWVYASTWLHLEARGLSCSMAVAETAIMAFHRYHGYWGYPISFRGLVFLVCLGGWQAKTIQWNKPCRWLKPSEKGCLHIDSGMVISSWICLPEPKGNPFTDRQTAVVV